jgi:hypothetical protein
LLIARAPFLRADLGLDFIFIVIYSGFFVSLALVLKRWAEGQPFQGNVATIVNIATAALLITGVLDAAENAHILSMLSMAEQGQTIAQGEIVGQMVASQIKFMFSYFGVFVLSFALPQSNMIEKLVVFIFRWVQLPVGVAVLSLPVELVRPIVHFSGGLLLRRHAGDGLDHRAARTFTVVNFASTSTLPDERRKLTGFSALLIKVRVADPLRAVLAC